VADQADKLNAVGDLLGPLLQATAAVLAGERFEEGPLLLAYTLGEPGQVRAAVRRTHLNDPGHSGIGVVFHELPCDHTTGTVADKNNLPVTQSGQPGHAVLQARTVHDLVYRNI